MAYAQATLTSANAANDFANVLDGLFTVAGWETVETLTPSGNFRNRVYKSPGLTNLCGYDWYIAMSWTTIGTENYVEVWAAEEYDATTNMLTGMLGSTFPENPGTSSTRTTQPVTGHFLQNTFNMGTKVVSASRSVAYQIANSSTSAIYPGFQTLIPSSAFAYWMSVTLDHVGIFTTVAVNAQNAVYSTLDMDAAYVASGLYDPTPIIGWDIDNFLMSSSLYGVPTSNNEFRGIHATFSGVYGSKLPALSDEYYDAYAWRPNVYLDYMNGGTAGANPFQNSAITGEVLVGTALDIYLVWGGSIGDTVTIDAATYVLTGPMANTMSVGSRPTIALLVE